MAAALLEHHAQGRVRVRSGGSAPADRINLAALAAMQEIGIDMSREHPKLMTDEAGAVQEAVRRHYAELAVVAATRRASCCGEGSGGCFGPEGYGQQELGEVPEAAANASLGCGNPTAVAELAEGEVVLDLGSGGGIDVILSARRVGPDGKAFGLDMTDEMLDLARRNAVEAGIGNVEFLKGHLEAIPLPDECVDVVISNCVINLSTDKERAIGEAARVLRPGGSCWVTDVVAEPELAEA